MNEILEQIERFRKHIDRLNNYDEALEWCRKIYKLEPRLLDNLVSAFEQVYPYGSSVYPLIEC